MSVPSESNPSGEIPSFPFHELKNGTTGPAGPAGAAPAAFDFDALRSALAMAVQALRSFHECVGVLEHQQQQQRAGAVTAAVPPVCRSAGVALTSGPRISEPAMPPRDVFPLGQLEAGVLPRAVMTPTQQAQLDAALAQAFAEAPAVPPRVVIPVVVPSPPSAPPPTVGAMAGPTMPPETGGLPFVQTVPATPPWELAPAPPAGPAAAPAFALVQDVPPASPFAMGGLPSSEPGSRSVVAPLMPAPAALVAAAPPLPGGFAPFVALPGDPLAEMAAPVPPSAAVSLHALINPTAVVTPPPPLPAAPPQPPPVVVGSSLPFSPFQGLEPAPAPPPVSSTGHALQAPPTEAAWPSSPFFGSSQAATAPFRMVEPPPVIASTLGGQAALAPAASPARSPALLPPPPTAAAIPTPSAPSPSPSPSTFPPIPEQGQVFNFAELLRANGQR